MIMVTLNKSLLSDPRSLFLLWHLLQCLSVQKVAGYSTTSQAEL